MTRRLRQSSRPWDSPWRLQMPKEFGRAVEEQRRQVHEIARIIGLKPAHTPGRAVMYVFDNAAPQARARLGALADVHDAGTIRHLLALGVADGWKCLEIGGGLGTITRWMSDRVGLHGYVLTTDIDTRFLETVGLANVDVRRHDILTDPLPDATFDLAYARSSRSICPTLTSRLTGGDGGIRPGGWLMVEDFEASGQPAPNAQGALDRLSRTPYWPCAR